MQLQGQHLYVLTESLASIPLSVSIIIFFTSVYIVRRPNLLIEVTIQ